MLNLSLLPGGRKHEAPSSQRCDGMKSRLHGPGHTKICKRWWSPEQVTVQRNPEAAPEKAEGGMNEKLQVAIAQLGERWILHPRSTFNAANWRNHTATCLQQIRSKALQAGRL